MTETRKKKREKEKIWQHVSRLWRWYVAGLAILAALSQGATSASWIKQRVAPESPEEEPMSGEVKVAVADFHATANSGDHESVERTATDLGESIAHHILENLTSTIGEDFEIDVRGPSDVGRLAGQTREQIAENARERAEQLAASVVVDGELAQSADTASLQLFLYFQPGLLPGAEELTGIYELGTVASVPGDVSSQPVVRKTVREDALAKVTSLVRLIAGVGHYSRDELAEANRHLDAVALQGDHALPDGGVLLHVMRGNVALKSGRFDQAEVEYRSALARRAGYARAYIGLAEATFLRAVGAGDCMQDGIDVSGIQAAVDQYRAADRSEYRPPLSDIAPKVEFGLGRALWCLSNAGAANAWDAAEAHYQRVITAYDGGNERIRELAAEAHAGLGLLTVTTPSVASPDYPAALRSYNTAIVLTQRSERRGVFTGALAGIQARLGDVVAAVTSYERAAALDPERAASYQAERDKLMAEVPI
jgi:tetratricopeptide (TPR) repeat protein